MKLNHYINMIKHKHWDDEAEREWNEFLDYKITKLHNDDYIKRLELEIKQLKGKK